MKGTFTLLIGITFLTGTSVAQGLAYRSVNMSATVHSDPPTIELIWPCDDDADSFTLYKRTLDGIQEFSDTPFAELDGTACSYTDTDVLEGVMYDYILVDGVGYQNPRGYLTSGVKVDESSYRGKLILVHDTTYHYYYRPEFKTFMADLEGDGYEVVLIEVAETDESTEVKDRIVDAYSDDPENTTNLFLFGHVPVVYSGKMAPDGHSDHSGAWPTDLYYADMTGVWEDDSINSTTATNPRHHNVPGDGKFDHNWLPTTSDPLEVTQGRTELQVGRVYFDNLWMFVIPEEELLRRYLVKDHEYRHKIIDLPDRALIHDNLGNLGSNYLAESPWRCFPSILGADSVSEIYYENVFFAPYKWSYGCGWGTYNSANAVISSSTYAGNEAQTIFTFLWGSYFGDWDSQDNLMRCALGSGTVLTSCWNGTPKWNFNSMSMGKTIGFNAQLLHNRVPFADAYGHTGGMSINHIGLMGDPTLRAHIVAPPSNLTSSPGFNSVSLSWEASPESVLGYDIYRKTPQSGRFEKVNSQVVEGPTYIDSQLTETAEYNYMVRAVKLEESRTGTYYNRSQGVFDTTEVFVGVEELYVGADGLEVYPNPAKDVINIKAVDGRPIEVGLTDISGKQIISAPWRSSLDVSEIPNGTYLLMVEFEDGTRSSRNFTIQH